MPVSDGQKKRNTSFAVRAIDGFGQENTRLGTRFLGLPILQDRALRQNLRQQWLIALVQLHVDGCEQRRARRIDAHQEHEVDQHAGAEQFLRLGEARRFHLVVAPASLPSKIIFSPQTEPRYTRAKPMQEHFAHEGISLQ